MPGRAQTSGRPLGNILRDDLIALTSPAANSYPVGLRRVVALVEVDGELAKWFS